jgi:hypothetical protein
MLACRECLLRIWSAYSYAACQLVTCICTIEAWCRASRHSAGQVDTSNRAAKRLRGHSSLCNGPYNSAACIQLVATMPHHDYSGRIQWLHRAMNSCATSCERDPQLTRQNNQHRCWQRHTSSASSCTNFGSMLTTLCLYSFALACSTYHRHHQGSDRAYNADTACCN